MQLSTGRTTITSSGALFWSRGGGFQVLLYHVSRTQGVSPCTATRPLPRLVTIHPYSRSSALTLFFYRSLHFHTSPHHHLLCRGVISGKMSSWTVYGYRYVSLLCMVVPPTPPPTIIRWTVTHPIPEHTIHTTRRYTHPYPSHSDRYPRAAGCRWLVTTQPLRRGGYVPSTF